LSPIKKTIIILNGPPGCGKDYGAKFLCEKFGAKQLEFKKLLVELVKIFYNIQDSVWENLYVLKDSPAKDLGGLSPRQALIHVSEDLVKPVLGKDFFGKSLLQEIKSYSAPFFVASDGGFEEEIEPIRKDKNIRLVLVRILAEGKNFDNDSRTYLKDPDYTIVNHYDDRFENLLERLAKEVCLS